MPVTLGPVLAFGEPTRLFQVEPAREVLGTIERYYDVAPDGSRFLVRTMGPGTPTPVTVIVNWPALLQQ